ncbi:serine/threonine-protein kinase [Cylindrospermopsis raciborskii]|uniref:serine/threonine-protein kinase n=6 Tax=Cylindrospermopsis raciborskii TaxID=77022 RepID=UPI0015E12D84|nr:serine/threonine-protein kinase [Cylindrospermopsis raciborskii]
MPSPINLGTILQNRYHIIRLLGQGGFGRTYLAEDQGRFNELCAIKELVILEPDSYEGKKAQELFDREASILYQIDHPQIPKFREKFAQDQRLFLVQDFVGGKTYHTILNERRTQGQSFTQAEVLYLLQSLLPILEYIHKAKIIHRDISPDNLILRSTDQKPVLIDFGVVKEVATRLSNSSTHQATTVGKLGYSPIEQVQTGKAYPNSDLYALAVTAIVLLTGKEPADLFDETTFVWKWQHWVQVSPKFAQVLNRMLSRMPGDRYKTAKEVLLDLTNLEVSSPLNPGDPNLSYLPTVAISHPSPTPTNSPEPVISPHTNSSILDNTLAMVAIGGFIVILAGFSSWSLVNYLRGQRLSPPTTPQNFDSPVIPRSTPNSTFTPTPSKTEPRNLAWDSSNNANEEGIIKFGEVIEYSFRGSPGQKLTIAVNEESGVLLTILTADGQPLSTDAQQVTSYERVLTSRGRLTIQLTLSTTVSESNYSLSVALENPIKRAPIPPRNTIPPRTTIPTPLETIIPTPTPIPTETPVPTLTPAPLEDPIPTPTTTPIPTPIPTEEPTIVPTISEDGV